MHFIGNILLVFPIRKITVDLLKLKNLSVLMMLYYTGNFESFRSNCIKCQCCSSQGLTNGCVTSFVA